eukprot:133957_1
MTKKEEMTAEYAYKDMKFDRKCNVEHKLEIDVCPFIECVIYSLNIYEDMKAINEINYQKFNLQRLVKCYDHIICVHLFCLKSDERIKIQEYVCKIVGKCKSSSNCLSI